MNSGPPSRPELKKLVLGALRDADHARDAEASLPRHLAQRSFGIGVMVLAIFLLIFSVYVLPQDSRRWLFVGFCVITLVIGIWQLECATKKLRALSAKVADDDSRNFTPG